MSDGVFLPFIKPDLSETAIQGVVDVLQSGWLSTGPKVAAFEAALSEYLQAETVLTFSSGTAALYLALKILDLQPGDEVILPSLTFVATANTVVQAGGVPVFVDVEQSYNIDVTLIEQAITKRTRAVIPVHMAGLTPDLDPIYTLAAQHNLVVIEDAAQAIDGAYKGRKIGSFGDQQMFSFQATKNLSTVEGGCLVVRDAKAAEMLKALRFHGINRDAWDRFTKKGSQHYDVVSAGYKYNLSDVNAVIGLAQMASRKTSIDRRNHMAKTYMSLLKDIEGVILPEIPAYATQPGWHLFMIQIDVQKVGMSRDDFMAKMKELNIGTGIHYLPVHLFSFYRTHFGYKEGMLPITERATNQVVSLPFYIGLTQNDQERVASAVRQVLQQKG